MKNEADKREHPIKLSDNEIADVLDALANRRDFLDSRAAELAGMNEHEKRLVKHADRMRDLIDRFTKARGY